MKLVLFLDTSIFGVIRCALYARGQCVAKKTMTTKDNKNSSVLLRTIDALLRTKKVQSKDLSAIAVVKGPGPFTALRVGVVTANALAWALGIPVYGVTQSQFVSGKISRKIAKQWNPVLPVYGKEPNITIRKGSVISH